MNNEKDIFKSTEGVLYNYSLLKAEINNLALEIEEVQDEYTGVGAITYEERTGPTNKTGDSVAAELIHKEKLIYKLERAKRSKERLIKKIDNALESLNEEEKNFIKYRYTDNVKRSWDKVGELMGLDPNYCCNIIRPQVIRKLSGMIFVSHNF